jgi:hypothetical protein
VQDSHLESLHDPVSGENSQQLPTRRSTPGLPGGDTMPFVTKLEIHVVVQLTQHDEETVAQRINHYSANRPGEPSIYKMNDCASNSAIFDSIL